MTVYLYIYAKRISVRRGVYLTQSIFRLFLNSNKWRTNPASGQSGTRTQAHRIATPTRLPLGQAASFKSNSVGIQTYSSDRLLACESTGGPNKMSVNKTVKMGWVFESSMN